MMKIAAVGVDGLGGCYIGGRLARSQRLVALRENGLQLRRLKI